MLARLKANQQATEKQSIITNIASLFKGEFVFQLFSGVFGFIFNKFYMFRLRFLFSFKGCVIVDG